MTHRQNPALKWFWNACVFGRQLNKSPFIAHAAFPYTQYFVRYIFYEIRWDPHSVNCITHFARRSSTTVPWFFFVFQLHSWRWPQFKHCFNFIQLIFDLRDRPHHQINVFSRDIDPVLSKFRVIYESGRLIDALTRPHAWLSLSEPSSDGCLWAGGAISWKFTESLKQLSHFCVLGYPYSMAGSKGEGGLCLLLLSRLYYKTWITIYRNTHSIYFDRLQL